MSYDNDPREGIGALGWALLCLCVYGVILAVWWAR